MFARNRYGTKSAGMIIPKKPSYFRSLDYPSKVLSPEKRDQFPLPSTKRGTYRESFGRTRASMKYLKSESKCGVGTQENNLLVEVGRPVPTNRKLTSQLARVLTRRITVDETPLALGRVTPSTT